VKKFLLLGALLIIGLTSFAQSDELMNGTQQLMQKFTEGDYARVLSLSERMLALAEKEFGKTDPIYGVILSLEAGARAEMGDLEGARKNYKTSFELLKQAPAQYEAFVGRIYAGLATIAVADGDYGKGEQLYLKSLTVFKRTVGINGPDYANSVNNLGNLYKDLGDYAKAERELKTAADIRRNVYGENHSAYGVSLNNLASLYEQLGNYNDAKENYIAAYHIFRKTLGQYHPLIATVFNNYAGVYMKEENYNNAIPLYDSALAICEKVYGRKHDRYLSTLSNLGNAYYALKKLDQAEEYTLRCVLLRKELFGTDHLDYAYSLNNLGLIKMNRNKYDEAEKNLREALAIFEKKLGKNHKNVAACAFNLAIVYFKNGNAARAATHFKQSLDISLGQIDKVFPILSDNEKTMFYLQLRANFEVFNYFVSQSYKENNALISEMYNNTVSTKALLLRASNKIKKKILSSGDTALVRLFNDWRSKKNILAQVWQMSSAEQVHKNLNQSAMEAELEQIERKLSESSQLFDKEFDKKKYTWKDIQKNLKPDEAAVEIVRFRKYSFDITDTALYAAMIVKPTSTIPEVVILEKGNFLETKLITYYKNAIGNSIPDTKSYGMLWAGIAAKLKGVKKVYLSPDGVFNQVNVNSLYNVEVKRYVVDEVEIQLVTNTKDILSLPKKITLRNAIMIGFPDYKTLPGEKIPGQRDLYDPSQQLTDSAKRGMGAVIAALPGTLTEVNSIASVLKQKNIETKTVIGVSANEAFLKKLQSPSILHIATHGFFLEDIGKEASGLGRFIGGDQVNGSLNPLLHSGILLAGAQKTATGIRGEGEDGILYAYEAMNLDLDNTDLVILSACETGLGKIRNGEGVYGLQRALIIAGAQTIVMSLWKVSDEVTQQLMIEFYNYWMTGVSKREAFIKAQTKIRNEHPEPYYWAPFIMIGGG
jgi:CHAT domain-containing protein/Tfp pilus assembly protein PilF